MVDFKYVPYCIMCNAIPAYKTVAICQHHTIGEHRSCLPCFRAGKYIAQMRCGCAGLRDTHVFIHCAVLVNDEWETSW